MYITEINNYKQQCINLQNELNALRNKKTEEGSAELLSLRQQINVYVT